MAVDALPRLVALLVLCHCLTVLSYPPLFTAMATLLMHPRLDLAAVKMPKLDLLSAKLDLARTCAAAPPRMRRCGLACAGFDCCSGRTSVGLSFAGLDLEFSERVAAVHACTLRCTLRFRRGHRDHQQRSQLPPRTCCCSAAESRPVCCLRLLLTRLRSPTLLAPQLPGGHGHDRKVHFERRHADCGRWAGAQRFARRGHLDGLRR